MIGGRQFSLSYLLMEVFWIGLAMAATRAVVVARTEDYYTPGSAPLVALLLPFAAWFWIIAIGGMFGRMTAGAGVGFVAFWLIIIFMPAVMYASH
jgi:hypothetical protein